MAKPVMVKCMATGERGPRDTYYKAPNGRYFKSEEIYETWLNSRKEKAKCYATGAEGNKDEFFLAPNRKYFKSKEVYNEWIKNHRPKTVCYATGIEGFKDDFYHAPNGHWYQSEAVYEAWIAGRRKEKAKKNKPKLHEKPGRTTESYKKLCDTIADMIGYDPGGGQPMPRITFRRIKELDYYSDEIIQETLDEQADTIRWAMEHKEFKNDVGKVCYLMAIVQNNIAAVDRREKNKREAAHREERSNPDLDTMTDLENIGAVHKGRDIRSLLGGDDLWI